MNRAKGKPAAAPTKAARGSGFTVLGLDADDGAPVRRLVVVLGDQLDERAGAFDDFDANEDLVFMAEVRGESETSTKMRTAMFLAAMRHFAQQQHDSGRRVAYVQLDDAHNTHDLIGELRRAVEVTKPREVHLVEPGEWRLLDAVKNLRKTLRCPVQVHEDRRFLCSHGQFAEHTRSRKQLRMEFFYREQRRAHGVLLDRDAPAGGSWNYDAENRKSFGKEGPARLPPRRSFPPDAITRGVMETVERELAHLPGSLAAFDWPVTRHHALDALQTFLHERLPDFGDHQDAMWTGEPWLYHAHLSAAMNLGLLNAREVIESAEQTYRRGRAPLAAVEGFIRQILGWREYVRGIYWRFMPGYVERNALGAKQSLPEFYWHGRVPMACLGETITQTLRLGYAHHIQRLMVTGLYALLLGVDPRAVHSWYLAVYVDAVEWVELPNTLGMSQYADGGVMASKPYVATGKYIDKMSNYCRSCPFDPGQSLGPSACPFTTLYWDFLATHADMLRKNQRMALQVKNLDRLDAPTRAAIAARAAAIRAAGGVPPTSP